MAKVNYQQIIINNNKRFHTGKVTKRRTMCKLFKIKNPIHTGDFAAVQRTNLDLVHTQAEINNILRLSGLVMKSRGYYSEFYICDLQQTTETVLAQQRKSEAYKYCSNILEKAVIQRITTKTWGSPDLTVSRLTATAQSTPSATYGQKKKRMKRINQSK